MPTPEQIGSVLDRVLKKLPEPATYEADGAAIVKALRRYYGDETGAVLRVAVEQCETREGKKQ